MAPAETISIAIVDRMCELRHQLCVLALMRADDVGGIVGQTGAGPVLPRTISSDASSLLRALPLSPRRCVISIWAAVTPATPAGMWTVVSRGVTISASAVSS